MSEKKIKYVYDQVYKDGQGRVRYVKCWSEGKGRGKEWAVQVWNGPEPKGEPAEDWGMPGVLDFGTAIRQAVLQTEYK